MKKLMFAALSLVVLTSCGGVKKKDAAVVAEPQKVLTKTATAALGEVAIEQTLTSEILPYKQNDITPAANGVRVDKIFVEVGDKVKEGQVLATLDPTQYNQQMISIATMESDYNRLLPVFEAGGISQQALDQAKASLDVQKEIAQNLKKNIEVKSPITGVVTARNTEAGNLFIAQPILHVMQIDRLKVKANISEAYFPLVSVGMPVAISSDIYPGETFEGKVSLIYPALDAQSRTFTVEITLGNQSQKLRPGMYARANISMGVKDGVLVPDVAIVKQMGTSDKFVYVIEGGVARYRRVETGRQMGSMVEVVSGLEAGEQVAVTAFSRLRDGAEVEVK